VSEFWLPWIGLPQIDGADPRAGVGGCCFRMTQVVREEMGLYWPGDRMADWYGMAEEGRWDLLRDAWEEMTFATDPHPGAFCLLDREPPPGAFGLGVLVDDRRLLTAIHRRGVVSVPRSVWKDWSFREVAP
jgi:hypothetical protein